MVLQHRSFSYIFSFIVIFFVLLKFFTAEILFADDPTSLLVFRSTPSFDNSITMEPNDSLEGYYLLVSDENGFVGEGLYFLIVQYLWWAMPLLGFVFISYNKLTKPST